MKPATKILTALLTACLLAPGAMAVSVGTDITLYDGQTGASGNVVQDLWWNNIHADGYLGRNFNEDDEVEPSTTYNYRWDLEGLYLAVAGNLATLNMVSTFNPRSGLPDPDTNPANRNDLDSGDLFLSNVLLPDGGLFDNAAVSYYLDMNWAGSTANSVSYIIYAVTANTVFTPSTFKPQSSPWRADGGTRVAGGVATITSATVDDHGLLGDNGTPGEHWIVAFNWNHIANSIGLGQGDTFSMHFTMSCGNDDLYGGGVQPFDPPVPEPASMALLGMGILGFAMRRRFIA